MDEARRDFFIDRWRKYFRGAELPLAFYYTDEAEGELPPKARDHRCAIADLERARRGQTVCFTVDRVGCFGGRRYFGFCQELSANFEHFLSSGIPGKLEGERYKKTPGLVQQLVAAAPPVEAPAPHLVFKRWDTLGAADRPEGAIFFAPPDVLAGLFTLANYDTPFEDGVIAPFCAGCASVVRHAYLQRRAEEPRAVLGMFDVSARPYVEPGVLSFAVPLEKFERMIDNMDESFLVTGSWKKVRRRIAAG